MIHTSAMTETCWMNAITSIDREHAIHTSATTEMCWMNALSSIDTYISNDRDVSDECDDQSLADIL